MADFSVIAPTQGRRYGQRALQVGGPASARSQAHGQLDLYVCVRVCVCGLFVCGLCVRNMRSLCVICV